MFTSSPQNVHALLSQCEKIAGLTFAQAAKLANVKLPSNLQGNKGWIGQLLEQLLGADAGNQAIPDFTNLDIELKTIPVGYDLTPLESTYLTVVPLTQVNGLRFYQTHLFQKIKQILWVPIQGERETPLAERMIGSAFLWQPSEAQLQQIERDFDEFMELIALGQVNRISASMGNIIQIRPKAANSSVKTLTIGSDGNPTQTLPRGFYLRAEFTKKILSNQFG